MTAAARAERPKRIIRTGPLLAGYALSQLRFLHPILPDRIRYNLPLDWTLEMLQTFLGSGREKIYIDVPCPLDVPDPIQAATPVDPQWRMSPEQIEQFWTQGFVGPFSVLPPEDMAARASGLWNLFDSPSRTYPANSYEYFGTTTDGTQTELSNEDYARRGLNGRDKHLEDGSLLDLYASPAIVERVAQLIGPEALLWRTQFFPKYPGMGGTAWHQATEYLNETMRVTTLHPDRPGQLFQVTVWIAITDSTLENGCLRFVPGSHKRLRPMRVETFDPIKHADNKSDRFGDRILQPDMEIGPDDPRNMVMKAGEFVIFSERIMHGSLPNVSTHDKRLGMSGRYIRPDVLVHNPWVLGDGGLTIAYLRVRKLKLDRWRAIRVRGDNSGVNADRVLPYQPGQVVVP